MEFIQCPHCEKKYSVHDNLKAASGRQIRCKHCSKVFEIVIHDDHQPLNPMQHTEPVESENKIEQQPAGKKINLQALISIILGITLICASIGGYLYLNKPELFDSVKQPVAHPIIPHDLVNPMATELPKPATSGKTKSPSDRTESRQSLQACKGLSADYWVRTRLLATANLATDAYMELLNMNLEQAQEIRKFCKDKSLIAKLSEAARTNKKPQWIKTEIAARLRSQKTSAHPTDHP